MQWIPVSRELLDALPSDRPFTKLEAAVKLTADLQDGISRSMRENGRILGWDHKTVKSFIESGLLVRLGNSPDESNNNSALQDNIPQDLAKISDSPNAPHSFPKCSPYKHNDNVLLQDAIPQTLPTYSPNAPQLYSRESLERKETCPTSHAKALFDLWNEVVAGTALSSVREFSSTRQKKCTARLKERPLDDPCSNCWSWNRQHQPDLWRQHIQALQADNIATARLTFNQMLAAWSAAHPA